ncbi:GNAT family N-acetyltransferase [Pseudoalteromonas xiamenensis]|uniref:GNAT family N-acetyltransferase n=1 Tax=Pseudoalteromonas xiamenensis TaxID=882626 RepID=UPI0027E48D40|nr:GNAT family N-acetyltransferase [Pseudoalteromonas xiamenensis]WMN59579.1 GNAT family N-acetyltransferase [Pseudoalteromonas xiamenensis]
MICVRLAEKEDLLGILSLYNELRPHDPTLNQQQIDLHGAQLLRVSNTKLIVALVEGKIASTCQLGIIPTLTNGARPFGVIEHVITSPLFRRRGLSQRVMEHALQLAWENSCYKVMLLSGELRSEAHRLYEKIGFQAGIEKGFIIKAPLKD